MYFFSLLSVNTMFCSVLFFSIRFLMPWLPLEVLCTSITSRHRRYCMPWLSSEAEFKVKLKRYVTDPTSAQGILRPSYSADSHPVLSPTEGCKTSVSLTELCRCGALETKLTLKAGLCSQELSAWDHAMTQRGGSWCPLSRRKQRSPKLYFRE